ncbi:4-(cytidine 5'-diphospho)-2-C-methyl-D-erythritol kinase [Jatrophihabitans sp.]|jgi:4-diphosphocytidyl-2-C-methyl-D-erythritol kinase|uniref:4-(cytidine 5'-diphospho)-2-C-methyl-D-erythritol kinase n=1 Tax=Jatrophihabitans sp. TaxID=1932789 RepID=UPI0032C2200D
MPAGSPGLIRVRVPAKVNLHLSVGPLRPDGFHDLVTVFHAVDLTDDVTAAPAGAVSLTVSGEGAAELPLDAGNLAWRAAVLLAESAGVPARAALHITKSIPVAGGMAGGSADAAAALLACARLWDLDAGPAELTALAARLGSDAAFPLLGGTAVGTGRGEILEPVDCAATLHWVFALADFGISAGDAYRELDRLRAAGAAPAPAGDPDRLLAALADGDVAAVAAALVNDLEPAALSLAPTLRATLDAGRRRGALAALVSGSGPTCAFLCPDAAAAAQLAADLTADGVVRSARTATGPAAGARVAG